jgi:hypothetical protein
MLRAQKFKTTVHVLLGFRLLRDVVSIRAALNPLLSTQQLIIVYAINKGLPLLASLFRSEGENYWSYGQR